DGGRIEVDQHVAAQDYVHAPDAGDKRRERVLGEVQIAEGDPLADARRELEEPAMRREVPASLRLGRIAQLPAGVKTALRVGQTTTRDVRSYDFRAIGSIHPLEQHCDRVRIFS